MKLCNSFRFFLAALTLAAAPSSFAAYSCNVTATPSGMLLYYSTSANTSDAAGTVTLNCTRLTTDSATLGYRLLIDNGNNTSPVNRATGQARGLNTQVASTFINYGIFRNTAYSQTWDAPATGTTNVVTGSITFSGSNTSASLTRAFYLRVPSGQSTVPAGVYTDAPLVWACYPNATGCTNTASAPIEVTIGVGNQCIFNSTPGSINLNYPAFSATNQTASTNFIMRCTNALPYTLAISPTGGTIAGLTYTLALDSSSVTGTGLAQTRTITATMPSGQSGTCTVGTCSGSVTHTVTVTY